MGLCASKKAAASVETPVAAPPGPFASEKERVPAAAPSAASAPPAPLPAPLRHLEGSCLEAGVRAELLSSSPVGAAVLREASLVESPRAPASSAVAIPTAPAAVVDDVPWVARARSLFSVLDVDGAGALSAAAVRSLVGVFLAQAPAQPLAAARLDAAEGVAVSAEAAAAAEEAAVDGAAAELLAYGDSSGEVAFDGFCEWLAAFMARSNAGVDDGIATLPVDALAAAEPQAAEPATAASATTEPLPASEADAAGGGKEDDAAYPAPAAAATRAMATSIVRGSGTLPASTLSPALSTASSSEGVVRRRAVQHTPHRAAREGRSRSPPPPQQLRATVAGSGAAPLPDHAALSPALSAVEATGAVRRRVQQHTPHRARPSEEVPSGSAEDAGEGPALMPPAVRDDGSADDDSSASSSSEEDVAIDATEGSVTGVDDTESGAREGTPPTAICDIAPPPRTPTMCAPAPETPSSQQLDASATASVDDDGFLTLEDADGM